MTSAFFPFAGEVKNRLKRAKGLTRGFGNGIISIIIINHIYLEGAIMEPQCKIALNAARKQIWPRYAGPVMCSGWEVEK